MKNCLIACYKDFVAQLAYNENLKKWIGRIINSTFFIAFDGKDLEDALSTFHNGINEYVEKGGKPDIILDGFEKYIQDDNFFNEAANALTLVKKEHKNDET